MESERGGGIEKRALREKGGKCDFSGSFVITVNVIHCSVINDPFNFFSFTARLKILTEWQLCGLGIVYVILASFFVTYFSRRMKPRAATRPDSHTQGVASLFFCCTQLAKNRRCSVALQLFC